MDVNEESGDTTLYVEINSLEDWSLGKKLFKRFNLVQPNRHIDFLAMGIVEAGTRKGHTEVAFLLEEPTGGKFLAALPLKVLETLTNLSINADHNFKNKKPNKEEHN